MGGAGRIGSRPDISCSYPAENARPGPWLTRKPSPAEEGLILQVSRKPAGGLFTILRITGGLQVFFDRAPVQLGPTGNFFEVLMLLVEKFAVS